MPRQRKPQQRGVARAAGRVASTTTSKDLGNTNPTVYRIPTGWSRTECPAPLSEVGWVYPISVRREWNVFYVSLPENNLKSVIEGMDSLDLSNVNISLSTINWPLQISGGITTDGDITWQAINWTDANFTSVTATTWNITSITSTDITADTVSTGDLTATWTTTLGNTTVNNITANWNADVKWIMNVDGESTFKSNVSINGDATITGETNTETLSVNDFATIPTLTSTEITTDKLKVNDGAEVVGGLEVSDGLMVEWNTTLEKLLVQDDVTFEKDVTVEGTTNLKETNTENLNVSGNSIVNGNSTVSGDATIAGNATVSQDLLVAGNSTTTGNSLVTGNSVVNGDSTVNGDTSINWETNLNGKVKANDDVSIDGNLEVKDDVVVDWTTTLKGAVEMKDDVEILGSAKINGSLSVDEDVNIAGNTKTKTLRAEEAVFDEVRINRSLDLGDDGVAPDFVLQKEKGQPNGVAPLDVNGKIPQEYLPDVFTTAIVKIGSGIFNNSDTAVVVDNAITANSYVNISNYSDIHGDVDEIINDGQITLVSNQVEVGSFRYIVVNPIQ